MHKRVFQMTVGEVKTILDALSRRPSVHDDMTLGEVFGLGRPEEEEQQGEGPGECGGEQKAEAPAAEPGK